MKAKTHFRFTPIRLESLERRELCAVDVALADFHPNQVPSAPAAIVSKPAISASAHVQVAQAQNIQQFSAPSLTAAVSPTIASQAIAASQASPNEFRILPGVAVGDNISPQVFSSNAVDVSTNSIEKRVAAPINPSSIRTVDLKPTLGIRVEEFVKTVTPSWHRSKVTCKEFTVKSNGDVSLKIDVTYKGTLWGFPWSATAKLEVKTNLYDDSKFNLKVSVGNLPSFSIGINASVIKAGVRWWIATNSGAIRI